MAAAATRMLVVWCEDWPVAAAGMAPSAPVAVVEAGRVVACSAGARAEGVEPGFRRRQAEASCPALAVLALDAGRDARAFEPVVAAVESFTPRVEVVRPGVCAFATRGPSRYFGGDGALAVRVRERVGEALVAALGEAAPPCHAGVGDGRFAAERAARHDLVVPPGGSAAFLAPFAVSVLGRPDLSDLLVRLGIRTLGDLASLPARAVLARFGPDGATAHRLARGLDERPLSARTPPPDLVVTAELDPPAERVDTVAFVARSLAAELHDALAARGLAVGLVRIEVETEHGEHLARAWRFDDATPVTAATLAERVRWQLDGWLSGGPGAAAVPTGCVPERPTGPLTLLRLVPEEVRPDRGRQDGFWGGDRAAAERAARALARVQGRLGAPSVTTAVVQGGRSPAEQARLVPWDDAAATLYADRVEKRGNLRKERSGEVAATVPPWPGRLPSPAPATVLPAPARAEVVDADGRPVGVNGRGVASAAPARVSVAGGPPSNVVAWAGPWPLDERWWDAQAHRRRARWQVVTAGGDALLLTLEGGAWSVEAIYE